MIKTSHFLAATLNSILFVDLYAELQQYLSQFSSSDCIEFQNILSLHITLYYFPKDLTDEQLNKIKDDIKLLRTNTKITINIDNVGNFNRNNQDYLYYLHPSKFDQLSQLNDKFRTKYINDVSDNLHSFTPHMTLFKIKNYQTFNLHKEQILKIINKYLTQISHEDAFSDYNLYAVNSKFSPQIQIVIY